MFRLLIFTLGAIIAMMAMAQGLMSPAAPAIEAATPAKVAAVSKRQHSSDETVIQRDDSGQFRLTAQVNGEDTVFLIDTGADSVTLTTDDAERLGIKIDPDDFKPIVRTASGTGMGARIHLDQIEVAGHEFADVDALVVEGLDVNLLGQTLLRRMGRVELRGDTLSIRRAS
jgi:aspartyl protease family protein